VNCISRVAITRGPISNRRCAGAVGGGLVATFAIYSLCACRVVWGHVNASVELTRRKNRPHRTRARSLKAHPYLASAKLDLDPIALSQRRSRTRRFWQRIGAVESSRWANSAARERPLEVDRGQSCSVARNCAEISAKWDDENRQAPQVADLVYFSQTSDPAERPGGSSRSGKTTNLLTRKAR
jgi:hypothetical protein